MNDLLTQVNAMINCIAVARDPKMGIENQIGSLTMAFMHACNAATLADQSRHTEFGFKLHDYKHEIRHCIIGMLLGVPYDTQISFLKDWQP